MDWIVFGLNDRRKFFEIHALVFCVSLCKTIIDTDDVEKVFKRLARVEIISRDGPVVGMSDHLGSCHLV